MWPSLPVVEMNAVDTCLLRELKDLVDEQIPRFYLAIVQHSCIFVLASLAIGSVADASAPIFVKVVQEQVLELTMVATRRDSSQAVYDDLNTLILGLLHDLVEVFLSAEHFAGSHPIGHSQRRCISLTVLDTLIAVSLIGVRDLCVVSLEHAHEVQSRDTLLFIGIQRPFDILEGAPTSESLVLEIDFSVLIIDLHLMEAMISHALRMHNKATLRIQVIIILIVRFIYGARGSVQACDGERVRARRLSQERSAQLALIVDQDQAPVEESALPELAKVDRDLDVIRCDTDDVMWHDLVPREDCVMRTRQV